MIRPLFSQHDLADIIQNRMDKVRDCIDSTSDDHILSISQTDFTDHLVSKFIFHPPQLGDPFMMEPVEVDVDLGNDPRWARTSRQNARVKGFHLEIHIPFAGDAELFLCRPSSFTFSPPQAEVQRDHLKLIYERPGRLNPDEIKPEYQHALHEIAAYLENVQKQCADFNSQIENRITHLINNRKSRILENRQGGLNLGIPLKRRTNAPQTYVVPGIQRKPEIQRPIVKEKGYAPEPALAEKEYENILGIIRGMVSVMERSPHAFTKMGEEDLRSHFLVQLNGQYEGRATGETFNYQGKTDILIREGDRNVFIAECKIWKGEGELLKAIDQTLGYLHWRDTKTALLVFNRNKSFSEVLAKVPATIQRHTCCKRLIKNVNETEWRFLFRNPDDTNRELQLAVLLFDIPKEEQ